MAFLIYLILTLITVAYVLLKLSKLKFNFWRKQNVPYLEPEALFGNYKEFILMRKFQGYVAQELCKQLPKQPYFGAHYGTEPVLVVQEPEILKLILTKDFYYFSGREVSNYTHKELFTQNMFFTHGDHWKVLRKNFTPLFSSAKMRNMFHLIEKCALEFEHLIDKEATETSVEVRSLMARYTMDCIGACAFGVDTNTMSGGVENNPFRKIGDIMFEPSYIKAVPVMIRSIWPAFFYGIGLKVFPKALDDFFINLITNVFKARNYETSPRNDLVDLLLSLSKQNYIEGDSLTGSQTGESTKMRIKVNDEMLAIQCSGFFAGGFETSATTLSFTLYELAKDTVAQEKAIQEVSAYLLKHGNKLDYDCSKEMPFLTACIDEALRLYPVLPVLTREVIHEYVLPCGARIQPGVRIHIPLYHIHRHPDHFPDPDSFKPERFMPENKHNIKPYTYMPFGEGFRICIGLRFARMQIIPGLITILKSYRLQLAPETSPNIMFEPRAVTTQPLKGINLRFLPREDRDSRLFAR